MKVKKIYGRPFSAKNVTKFTLYVKSKFCTENKLFADIWMFNRIDG